jgi:alpha-glucosidase
LGAPTIYYGDEAGQVGFTDPDNRRTYPWGREDLDLITFHKDLIRLRREHDELRRGSIKPVAEDYNFLAYGRFHRKGQSLIAVNNNTHELIKELSVWELNIPKEGVMIRQLETGEEGYTTVPKEYPIHMGRITLTLPPQSAVILSYVGEEEAKKKADSSLPGRAKRFFQSRFS